MAMQSAMGISANAFRRCTDSARRRMLAAISIFMEGFLGLPESHESRVVVLMLAENGDNPTAICPIVNLPHTQSCFMARAAEQSLITGGRREDAARRFPTASALFGQRKFGNHRHASALGHRGVAFWTDDPCFRLRPKVANPSALSARC